MLSVRSARIGDAEAIAKVHYQTYVTSYRGFVPESFFITYSEAELTLRWRELVESFVICQPQNRDCLLVSEEVDCEIPRVVGFLHGGPDKAPGEGFSAQLYTFYILQEFQNKNRGSSLFRHFVIWLLENNFSDLRLWVFEDNPARRFYEKLGGKLQALRKPCEIEGQTYPIVSYGWFDLPYFLSQLATDQK